MAQESAKKPSKLQVNVKVTGEGKAPPLAAYLFSPSGQAIANAPVENGRASLPVPAELNGRRLSLFIAPRHADEQAAPAAAALRRAGAVERDVRYLIERPTVDLQIPIDIIPLFCACHVRGRLVKRVLLPNGTIGEQVVCNARVHICEVDRLPILIERLPDRDIFRLRDDLLELLRRPVPPPPPEPFPPVPGPFPPGPGPVPPGPAPEPLMMGARSSSPAMRMAMAAPAHAAAQAGEAAASPMAERAMLTLQTVGTATQLRRHLVEISDLIRIYLCELRWLWWWFRVDCLWTVDVDEHGRFDAWIFYRCNDHPDLY
ncbi:MAG: hypothetical protein QN178_10870, partial [Armatimonadota bacterium]|nr:hypothetical protein [Armatimonadota bacterium]